MATLDGTSSKYPIQSAWSGIRLFRSQQRNTMLLAHQFLNQYFLAFLKHTSQVPLSESFPVICTTHPPCCFSLMSTFIWITFIFFKSTFVSSSLSTFELFSQPFRPFKISSPDTWIYLIYHQLVCQFNKLQKFVRDTCVLLQKRTILFHPH